MKRLLLFLLLLLPACICMTVIFQLSSQTASDSSNTSAGFIEWAFTAFFQKFGSISAAEQQEIIDSCQFAARKTAHFSLYALLGILWIPPTYTINTNPKAAAFWAWSAATVYAITDEIHQKFVPGRSGEIRDVLIDSAGAAVGILLVCLMAKIILSKRIKKQKDA